MWARREVSRSASMPVILAMMGLTISQCADFMTVPSSFVAHCIMEEEARSEVFFVTLLAA